MSRQPTLAFQGPLLALVRIAVISALGETTGKIFDKSAPDQEVSKVFGPRPPDSLNDRRNKGTLWS